MAEPDDDDAALTWEGDERFGRSSSLDRPARPAPRDDPATAADGASAQATADEPEPRDVPRAVLTGVAAALFLAETVGWILVVQGVQAAGSFATGSSVLDFFSGIARFLALLAAPLWLATTVRLTRARRVRIGWLALGIGLLVPWPLLLGLIA